MTNNIWTAQQWIRNLEKLDRSKSTGEKFRDFCEMAYCAFAKLTAPTPERADELEARYMQIVESYRDKDTVRAYPEFLDMAWTNIENGHDFLGEASSQLNVLNAKQGQFFTPYQVSRMMAKMTLDDVSQLIERQGYLTMQEPAVGAGGMVLAVADEILEQGFNPMIHMLVHTIDISQLCYHMCFVQLACKGVTAYVERGNSLSHEHFEGAWTPHAYIFKGRHGHLFRETMKEPQSANDGKQAVRVPDEAYVPLRQLPLFPEV